MAISVEYLAIFRRTDTFCDSAGAFTRLLQVNSDIVVNGGTITFKKMATCEYALTSGDVADKGQRYFHLKFTWNGDPDAAPKELTRFISLLRAVRGAISTTGGEVETLHDDLSTHYARKAYPLIHDIENLMRRLIANFMLVNVGIEWTTEVFPTAVADAVRKSKRKGGNELAAEKDSLKDYLNVLNTLDFIHLGNILFDAYSRKTVQDLYAKLRTAKTVADVEALKDYLPESNWKRYFFTLIECEDGYLDTRWKRLYDLRCKVAHNALMTGQDYDEITKLIGEIEPTLTAAIKKLPQVTVPPGEVEMVAESAARNINVSVGEFVASWQKMEAAIARRVDNDGKRPVILTPRELRERNILDGWRMDLYEDIRQLRNRIVHGPAPDVPLETLQAATANIRRLIESIESESIIARLKAMNEDERKAEIESLLDDAKYDITESEEFCNAQAITNATSFDVDEYDIDDIEMGDDECTVKISYGASGEQLEDKMYFGNRITGEAEFVIDWDGEVTFQNVTAEVDHGDFEEDEYDPGDIDEEHDEFELGEVDDHTDEPDGEGPHESN